MQTDTRETDTTSRDRQGPPKNIPIDKKDEIYLKYTSLRTVGLFKTYTCDGILYSIPVDRTNYGPKTIRNFKNARSVFIRLLIKRGFPNQSLEFRPIPSNRVH